MAGILIAPEAGLVVENLALLIVVALAAAAIAQLKSLPWAFIGGHRHRPGRVVRPAVPQVRPELELRPRGHPGGDPRASPCCSCPRPGWQTGKLRARPAGTERLDHARRRRCSGPASMFALVAVWANGWIPWFSGTNFGQRSDVWLGRGAGFMVLGVITLSLVPLIGWAGQVSFANFAIAGIGAACTRHFGGQNGDPRACCS